MVNMPASLEAAKLARKYIELPVGIHFVLTGGRGISKACPLTRAKSLVDKYGYFFSPEPSTSFWEDKIYYWQNSEILKELKAQILLFKKFTGKFPTHITSHHHIHAHPKLLPIFISLAKKYDIPLRIPIFHGQPPLNKKLINLRKKVLMTNSFVIDYKGNYKRATFKNFYQSLKKIPFGTAELMVHPAFPDIGEDKNHNNWWRRELKMLQGKSFVHFISSSNIKLINYSELRNYEI